MEQRQVHVRTDFRGSGEGGYPAQTFHGADGESGVVGVEKGVEEVLRR